MSTMQNEILADEENKQLRVGAQTLSVKLRAQAEIK